MDNVNTEVKAEGDDEWEEVTMVMELNGVLDTTSTRMAIQNGNCAVRHVTSDTPLVQIGNSIYSGHWLSTVGTDLIFEQKGNRLQFCAVSETQLSAVKALVTTEADAQTTN